MSEGGSVVRQFTDLMYLLGCFICSYSAYLIVEGEVLIAARGDRSDVCPLAFLSG